jgi:viroplasmin and RNaseH domain-containing protein
MRIYFASRVKGGSHEWAMRRVIESRYPISKKNRNYVKHNILDKISLDQSEEDQLKTLVYMILCYEHKPPSTAYVSEDIHRQIDDIYDSLCKKYSFKEKDIDSRNDAKSYFDQGISCINDKQDSDLINTQIPNNEDEKQMSKVRLGDVLSCEICGRAVIVDEECGCATIDLICCGESMVNLGPEKSK